MIDEHYAHKHKQSKQDRTLTFQYYRLSVIRKFRITERTPMHLKATREYP